VDREKKRAGQGYAAWSCSGWRGASMARRGLTDRDGRADFAASAYGVGGSRPALCVTVHIGRVLTRHSAVPVNAQHYPAW
jgi:hypothetical protein